MNDVPPPRTTPTGTASMPHRRPHPSEAKSKFRQKVWAVRYKDEDAKTWSYTAVELDATLEPLAVAKNAVSGLYCEDTKALFLEVRPAFDEIATQWQPFTWRPRTMDAGIRKASR